MEVGADKLIFHLLTSEFSQAARAKSPSWGGHGQGWDLLWSPGFLVVLARTAGVRGVGVKRALKKEK